MVSAGLKCFFVCLTLICVSNGKVMAEQPENECLIDIGVTMFARPVETDQDQKDCDCYHIRTVTVFRLTGPIDSKIVLSSVAIPLASLLGIGQDEIIHDCSKTQVFENHTIVIMRSCFYADLNCLKERFLNNEDAIFNGLVKGSDCWVKKNPVIRLFLLGEHNNNRPKKEPKPLKELRPTEKAKKYNI